MKKIKLMSLLMAALATVAVSCSKSEVGTNPAATTSSTVTQGNWKVTYVTDNGVDHTSDFVGFKAAFAVGGTVTASNDLLTINGTWSSYNDDSQNKLLLNFSIATLASFAYLNEDWHILERTSTKLRMEHVSGGSGVTDYLTIEMLAR